jgi:hypothetical protein
MIAARAAKVGTRTDSARLKLAACQGLGLRFARPRTLYGSIASGGMLREGACLIAAQAVTVNGTQPTLIGCRRGDQPN